MQHGRALPDASPRPPPPENLELLKRSVLDNGLDFGIAFDGDADRIGVIDARGETVWGDKLMVLFSRAILARHPGAAIISEVKCSQTLYDDITAHGGRAIMWRTGHSLIKKKMKEEKALLAGEMSGHMFFADRFFGFDDAVYAACACSRSSPPRDQPLSAQLTGVPATVSTPEIRIDCPDEIKFSVVSQVAERFKRTHKVVDVDGVRVLFQHGWGLLLGIEHTAGSCGAFRGGK